MANHVWLTRNDTDPDGDWGEYGKEIDNFARRAEDPHNGPKCKLCGFNFCMHCHPSGWKDTNCVGQRESIPNGPAMSEAEFRAMSALGALRV